LVNNAGLMLLGPVVGADVEQWERMIAVNQSGLLYITHAALPHLLAAAQDELRGVADIVNISSIAGRQAWTNFGVYNMTKFGVNGFTEALRQEVTKKHVRVGVLEPGAVATELVSRNNEQVQAELASDADRIPEPLEPRTSQTASRTWSPALAAPPWPSCGPCPPHRPEPQASTSGDTMKYRTLPGTGVSVLNLALGTMGFGTETDEPDAFAILDRFVDADGNLIDTSNVYGGGAAEEMIGRWLASRPADGDRPCRSRHKGPVRNRPGCQRGRIVAS
jgi:short chain dehydrogenase/Aldo/keto reductase family